MLDTLSQILVARTTPLDLVYLVDENDALLGIIEIAVGCQDQPGKKGLHVISDVPGFGQAGRIADDQGDVEITCQASTRWVLPLPEGPIRRMLDFSTIHHGDRRR